MEHISIGEKWFVHLTDFDFKSRGQKKSLPIIVEVIAINPGIRTARVKTKSGNELSIPLNGFWLKAPKTPLEEVAFEELANKFNSNRLT